MPWVTGCRAAAVALALALHPWLYIVLPLVTHYLMASFWEWYIQPEFDKERNVEKAFLEGFTWLIGPMQDDQLCRVVMSCLIFFLEDLYLMILWAEVAPVSSPIVLLLSILITADLTGRILFIYYSVRRYKFIVKFENIEFCSYCNSKV